MRAEGGWGDMGGVIILLRMLNVYGRVQRGQRESIFTQSMADMALRKNRMLASTGFSNLNSTNTPRLPQLSRSFSSSKSTKLKLTTIEATLSTISQQLQELRLDTRESRRFCNFLRDDLAENTLGSLKLELATTINKFEKAFKLAKKNDEDRSNFLNADCNKLREGSTQLKNLMAKIDARLDCCEQAMGIYSGKQRHKV